MSKDDDVKGKLNGIESLKKRLCDPPGIKVASCGDPEVEGLFIGAGEGLSFGLEYIKYGDESPENSEKIRKALHYFEKEVVTIESEYIRLRKYHAQETVDRMKDAIDKLILATGGEVYGGG